MHPRNSVAAGNGGQQVALAVPAPSAVDAHPGLWPVQAQPEDF